MKKIILFLLVFLAHANFAFADVKVGVGVSTFYGGQYGLSLEYNDSDILNKFGFYGALGKVDYIEGTGWDIGVKYYFRRKRFNPFIAYHAGVYSSGIENDFLVSPFIFGTGFSWKFFKELSFDLEAGYVLIRDAGYKDRGSTTLNRVALGLGFHYTF